MPAAEKPAIVARLRAAGCVFAEDEADLLIAAAVSAEDLAAKVDQRTGGMPLEQVVGWAEFCGQRIAVDPGVFVPRRRTEFLVHRAVSLARGLSLGDIHPVLLDLCCGAGAIGVAVTAALREAGLARPLLHCADLDPAAVRCARRNVPAGSQVYQGDLFEPLPAALRGSVHLLLANVPYVPTAEIGLLPAEARLHERRLALDGGADGLDVLRRVAAQAPQWLAAGGYLLSETSQQQAAAAAAAFAAAGLAAEVAFSAEFSATVISGRMGS
jgi:release factor glutamine methyltransferase